MTECSMGSHLPLLDRVRITVEQIVSLQSQEYMADSIGVLCATYEQKTVDVKTGETLGMGEIGEVP